MRQIQEFKALDDQHRRKLKRYKEESNLKFEKIKEKVNEMKQKQIDTKKEADGKFNEREEQFQEEIFRLRDQMGQGNQNVQVSSNILQQIRSEKPESASLPLQQEEAKVEHLEASTPQKPAEPKPADGKGQMVINQNRIRQLKEKNMKNKLSTQLKF